jgi:hypothetical protein
MVTVNFDPNSSRQGCINSQTSKFASGFSFRGCGCYSYGNPYYYSAADDILKNKESAKHTGKLVGAVAALAALLLSRGLKMEGGKIVLNSVLGLISVAVGIIAGVLTSAVLFMGKLKG